MNNPVYWQMRKVDNESLIQGPSIPPCINDLNDRQILLR